MRTAIILVALSILIVTCSRMDYVCAHGSECRNDDTGEVREFDGPCPQGWHPVGGWVQ